MAFMSILFVFFPIMIIIAAGILCALLFGIFALIASAIGGAAAAKLVKDKMTKRLVLVGFGILSFAGLVCLFPFVALALQIPEIYYVIASMTALVCIMILCIIGIKFSRAIQSQIPRTIVLVLFGFVLASAASIAIFIPIVRHFLISQ